MVPCPFVSNGTTTRVSGTGAYMARIQIERRHFSFVQESLLASVTTFSDSYATSGALVSTSPAARRRIVRVTSTSNGAPDQFVTFIAFWNVTLFLSCAVTFHAPSCIACGVRQ